MALRLLLYLNHFRKVRAIFNDHPLHDIPHANPRIYKKIYRDYLYHGGSVAERVQLLESNYRFVRQVFSPTLIRAIFVKRDFTLCSVQLTDPQDAITVRLEYDERFGSEGELTLGLFDERKRRLYSITFSLQAEGTSRRAFIGCMIGGDGASEETAQATRRITKELHGLRPKNLAFYLLQTILSHLGVDTLSAVGGASHIYGATPRRRKRIRFDYDQFWAEVGGICENDRFYALPLSLDRRLPDQIKSNKRALYQRRYALLDLIADQVRSSLSVSSGTGTVSHQVADPDVPAFSDGSEVVITTG
jgi:uncharacterized protein VirK/YbjX